MRHFQGILEITGVLSAICAWGLAPDLLWDYGYKLWAMIYFVLMPPVLFYIIHYYEDWRRNKQRARLQRRV